MNADRSSQNPSGKGSQSALVPIRTSADLEHPALRALFKLWKAKAGTRIAPARQEFDVFELKQWLPHIQLLDVIGDYADIRYRVLGTWLVDRYGQDDTGRAFSELGTSARIREVLNEHLSAARAMTPLSIIRPFYDIHGVKEFSNSERIMLPLSNDGKTCDKILSAIYYLGADN